MSHVYPFKVVDRGSETQLQVGEHLNYLIQFKGQCFKIMKVHLLCVVSL